ncbi:MAG: RIP metalloprotease RseP [Chloroflexi bacterium]|nr:RIP metalloprotease RseP [Chloroflexota bacterium]
MLFWLLTFFIILVPLVIIHELGHFFAAKNVGITVLEFGIGFPPRAATLFTRGDTIYTLNWIPIGGFVRPYGEDMVRPKTDEEMEADLQEIEGRHIENPKSVFEAGPWERLWFMFAGPLANFIAAFFIFVLIAVIGQPYREESGVAVSSVLDESPAAAAGLQEDDFITHIAGERVTEVEDFNARVNGPEPVALTVERDGDSFETTLAPTTSTDVSDNRVVVLDIVEGWPADGKLEEGDLIVAVDGEDVHTTEALIDRTKDRDGETIVYTIERDGETLDVELVPENLDASDNAKIGVTIAAFNPSLGFGYAQGYDIKTRPADGPVDAVVTGAEEFAFSMELIVRAPIMLIEGQLSPEQARPVSIVGIGQIGGEVIRQSIELEAVFPILNFMAIISIALAVTNLLPIPGLDGGRMVFVFIELLRGKPMEPEREGFVHMIGILFLLSLMAVVIFWDIVDPIDLNSF